MKHTPDRDALKHLATLRRMRDEGCVTGGECDIDGAIDWAVAELSNLLRRRRMMAKRGLRRQKPR